MTARGIVTPEDQAAIRAALDAQRAADQAVKTAILNAASRSSVRAVAEFSELSTNTISRWKRGE